ncbi:hypothetical protein B0H13DRAFT_2670347 [Mycena leptocephala]|nr:hypothetical protein B0H13DRAFT_2670347 [Mycena leptocephala]
MLALLEPHVTAKVDHAVPLGVVSSLLLSGHSEWLPFDLVLHPPCLRTIHPSSSLSWFNSCPLHSPTMFFDVSKLLPLTQRESGTIFTLVTLQRPSPSVGRLLTTTIPWSALKPPCIDSSVYQRIHAFFASYHLPLRYS